MRTRNLESAPRIDLDRARSLWEQGSAVFLDVRARTDYLTSHIPGALSIPLGDLSRRLGEVPRGRPVVTY